MVDVAGTSKLVFVGAGIDRREGRGEGETAEVSISDSINHLSFRRTITLNRPRPRKPTPLSLQLYDSLIVFYIFGFILLEFCSTCIMHNRTAY